MQFSCLGLALAALSPLVTAAPAAAACGDRPAAGVDWSKCEKRRLMLRGQDLSEGKFLRTDFGRSDLADVSLAGADLTEANFEHARLAGADLSGAVLTKTSGDRADFTKAVLKGADMSKAEMSRTDFTGADFTGANLQKAELGRAILADAVLDGVDLSRAEVARAVFAGASLKGSDLTGAYTYLTRFEATDLTQVKGLTQEQLEAACGDEETRLPEGLTAPAAWPCAKEE
jgi:uncharacterized protein YjbI with pentapeptide repeats